MNKEQFLIAVRQRLAGLPQSDIDRFVDYYAEMIDDQIEDGLGEEEAVAAMGTPEYVASQILMDTPLPKLVKAKAKTSGGLKRWQIVLIALGIPVWLPLLLGIAIIVFSLFVAIWAIVFSLFITVFALGISAVACIGTAFVSGFTPNAALTGAAGLILIGITILLFLALVQVAKGFVWLCKWIVKSVKRMFIEKGEPK